MRKIVVLLVLSFGACGGTTSITFRNQDGTCSRSCIDNVTKMEVCERATVPCPSGL